MVSLELEARLDNLLATAQKETADIDLFAPIPDKNECPMCMIPLLQQIRTPHLCTVVENVYAMDVSTNIYSR